MLRKKSESVEWLEFHQLQEFDEIKHGVFLKSGDEEFFLHAQGQKERADINCKRVCQILGCEHLVKGCLCHGKDVLEVDELKDERNCDGLITKKEGLGILMTHADCQAAIFYDPIHHVMGNVHAGWRGNVQNIYKEAVDQLKAKFGSDPAELLVCISPSLGPCCAEFKHYKQELPESFWEYQERENYFNLWEISRKQLLEAKVLDGHIEIARLCTVCHPGDFYSYRYNKTVCRNGTVATLKYTC